VKIPRSLVRLAPSGISFLVTVLLISMLGRLGYGSYSVLLALGSLLNSILFHCSRNLIVFRPLLDMSEGELADSWSVSMLLSLLLASALACFSVITPVGATLIVLYLFSQSLFERESEYLRSELDLRGYLTVACARPAWSLIGLAVVYPWRDSSAAPMLALLVVGLSPLAACRPRLADLKARVAGRGKQAARSALRLLPLGLVITASLSYIFISDALVKLVLDHVVDRSALGAYASVNDVVMPFCWVLIGAFSWDLVPAMVRMPTADVFPFVGRRLCGPATLIMLFAFGLLLPDVTVDSHTIDVSAHATIACANLSAATLSCIVFPALIALGRKYAAMVLSLVGIVSVLVLLLALFGPGSSLPAQAIDSVSMFVQVTLGITSAAVFFLGGQAVLARKIVL
jgi:hypothetical protein